jgi:hypothetical protein
MSEESTQIELLRAEMQGGFRQLGSRFDRTDEKVDALGVRLDRTDAKVDALGAEMRDFRKEMSGKLNGIAQCSLLKKTTQ